jgi:hypothetical protein
MTRPSLPKMIWKMFESEFQSDKQWITFFEEIFLILREFWPRAQSTVCPVTG